MEHGKRSYYAYGVWIFLALILIGVVVYFAIRGTNDDTRTVSYSQNFSVTYQGSSYNTSTSIESTYAQYVADATKFWGDILTEDTEIDITVTTFSEAPTSSGTVLARAGPYSSTNLKGGGFLEINVMASANNWTDVMKHEIGHIMGIGTNIKWNNAVSPGDHMLNGSVFSTSLGEYKESYGGAVDATTIPLGDNDGHFSEEIFDRELMTPYSDAPQPQPATKLTLGALQDLGWSLDIEKAESAN